MIQVVIVDDHAVVREGIRFLLDQQEDINVIGEGEDGKHAIQLAIDLLPDVLLLDLLMPNLDGVSAIREIKRLAPNVRIIILTSYHEDDQIFDVMKAGALSYLLKDTSPQGLISAVRAAARGESILHPIVASRMLNDIHRQAHSLIKDLTPREIEVLSHIARGYSNYEIASKLGISEQTVKTYVSNILSKLHLADRTQAAIYALQQRLVPLEHALDKSTKDREK